MDKKTNKKSPPLNYDNIIQIAGDLCMDLMDRGFSNGEAIMILDSAELFIIQHQIIAVLEKRND